MSDLPDQLRISIMTVEYDIAERRDGWERQLAKSWNLATEVKAHNRCMFKTKIALECPDDLSDFESLLRDYGLLVNKYNEASIEETKRYEYIKKELIGFAKENNIHVDCLDFLA